MAQRLLPLLVEPEALEATLGDPALLIVDLCQAPSYERQHVPGAVNLAYSDLLKPSLPAAALLPDEATLSTVMSSIGLRSDLHVVAYDDEGNGRASRLLWTLDAIGHFDYSLLDGGLTAWLAEGRPTESGKQPAQQSEFHAQVRNPDVVADKAYILNHLEDPNTVILDARSPAEYRGEDVRALRGGHIPGAVNLEWTQAIDRNNDLRLQPIERLRALHKEAGVTPDKEVITHCQSHHRSALSFFVLRYIGYPSVRGYAGSWSDWGNDPTTPVES